MPEGDIGDERNAYGSPRYMYTKQVKIPIHHIDKKILIPGMSRNLAYLVDHMSQHPDLLAELWYRTKCTLNKSWGRTFAGKANDIAFRTKLNDSDSGSMSFEQYQAIHDVLNDPNDPRWELMMYLAIIMIQCKTDQGEWVNIRTKGTADDNKWMNGSSIFQWVALYIHNTMGFRL